MVERRDLPLFAWGDALRTARQRRRSIHRRAAALTCLGAAVSTTIIAPPQPRLVWNGSASAPVGLYRIDSGGPVQRGDMVIARMPLLVRDLAARRRYLPANVPLVKRVAGVPGDRICAKGEQITRDGDLLATRRRTDGQGRVMPWWDGCMTLRESTLFLLMANTPDSFDGRYFGPISSAAVLGEATPLWVR